MTNKNIIYVCGNLGSGKTTISEIIAENLGYKYIKADISNCLLASFFSDIKKYFLQEQLTILLDKVMKIEEALSRGMDCVVDRSPYEDVFVFARLFLSEQRNYGISEEDKNTYFYVAKKILSDIPRAKLAIYCHTSPETCNTRLKSRTRPFEKLYPENHIYDLSKLYDEHIHKIDSEMVLKYESETYDIRNLIHKKDFIAEIKFWLNENTDFVEKKYILTPL